MSTIYGRSHLRWGRDGAAWVVSHGGAELARVVPDEKYRGMWRVRSPEGRLSDMANITWAKDAAAAMALAILNRSDDVRNGGGDGMEKGKVNLAIRVPPGAQRAPSGDADSVLSVCTP
jgi:hypothetical protein